jgi:murein DD-endopeptidase MepM/ murein hydrolase activator NlpD
MISNATLLIAALAMLQAGSAPAMAQSASPKVTWRPSRPQGGTLVRISVVVPGHGTSSGDTVPGPEPAPVAGTLAGEPLHFAPDRAGGFAAFGGIPVDATESIALHLYINRGSSRDTLVRQLRLSAVKRPVERLSVAPSFGTKPDSALAKRLADEARRAREVSVRAHETPALWRGAFLRPRATRVTSAFGGGREFNGTIRSRHMGVDFAGAVGTPVRATNSGVVALVDTFYLAGRAVYIDHGAGLVTAYFHLSRADVAVGDTVTRGQIIGLVGETGRVTGPHLHWVARYGAITVDPLGLVSLTAPRSPAPAAGAKRSPSASGTGERRAPR